jgi:hypothetical protein
MNLVSSTLKASGRRLTMKSQPKTLEELLRDQVLLEPDHELHQQSADLLAEIMKALEEARAKSLRDRED